MCRPSPGFRNRTLENKEIYDLNESTTVAVRCTSAETLEHPPVELLDGASFSREALAKAYLCDGITLDAMTNSIVIVVRP